jgi:hypothetical protein
VQCEKGRFEDMMKYAVVKGVIVVVRGVCAFLTNSEVERKNFESKFKLNF